MKPHRHLLNVFGPLAIGGGLLLSACATHPGPQITTPEEAQPKSATAKARKSLAVVYVTKAEELLPQMQAPSQYRQTRLGIAQTYALLDEPQTGQHYLPAMPRQPHSAASANDYMQYITVLAALGDYEKIEAAMESMHNRSTKALVRSYVVYYDAMLRRRHLATSLDQAASMKEYADPRALFFLAFGYQQGGHSAKARQTCLMPRAPQARFLTCAYMAATLGMAGHRDEMAFYIDQATSARTNIPENASQDSYALMLYGRALVFAGRLKEAKAIYSILGDDIDGVYLGSILAKRLRYTGNPRTAKSMIRTIESRFAHYKKQPGPLDYLYICQGDFLATLELFSKLNTQLEQARDPYLKAQLLLGAAQALADGYVYDNGAH